MSEFSNETSISDAVTDEAFNEALGEDLPQDVEQAADQPASSGENVVAAPDDDLNETSETDEPAKADEPEPPKVEDGQEPKVEPTDDELPNFKDAPDAWKNLREKYDTTKKDLADERANSLKDKFFTNTDEFLDELSGLSTSQLQQTQQLLVKRGIDEMPTEFAEYLAQVAPEAVRKTLAEMSPDTLAESLFGKGMSAQKAQKIIAQVKAQDLEEFLDDEEGEAIATPKLTQADTKGMTPEDVEKLVEQRIAEAGKPKQIEALKQRTYTEIMKPVESLLAEAGLKPSDTDSPEEREYKQWTSDQVIKDAFDFLMDDEKNKPRAEKMLGMFDNLDENGVRHLASMAAILAEEHAGKRIQMLTMQRAKTKSKGTEPKKTPPPVIPSSGSVPSFGNPESNGAGRISDLSESDFEQAGM